MDKSHGFLKKGGGGGRGTRKTYKKVETVGNPLNTILLDSLPLLPGDIDAEE